MPLLNTPAGHEHAVRVRLAHDPLERRRRVHPGADRPDDALVAEFGERGERLADRRVEVVVRVVHEHDVHPVEAEPLEALLERPEHAVAAEVPYPPQPGVLLERGISLARVPPQQPPDLGGEHELVARAPAQRVADAALGHPGAVVRRGVEEAHAELPRGVARRARPRVTDWREQPAERPRAEAEACDRHAGGAELALFERPHRRQRRGSARVVSRPASAHSGPCGNRYRAIDSRRISEL